MSGGCVDDMSCFRIKCDPVGGFRRISTGFIDGLTKASAVKLFAWSAIPGLLPDLLRDFRKIG